MALSIPTILAGAGAGFLIGGPIGAMVGAAAGAALGKKTTAGTVVLDTPSGPVAVNQNPGVPPAVQASTDLVNRLVTGQPVNIGPVNLGPVFAPDGTPYGPALQNPDGSVVTVTGKRLGPVYSPDGTLLGYIPASTSSSSWLKDLIG